MLGGLICRWCSNHHRHSFGLSHGGGGGGGGGRQSSALSSCIETSAPTLWRCSLVTWCSMSRMFGSQLEYLAATCIDMTRFQFESPSSAHVGCISAVIVDILLIVDEMFQMDCGGTSPHFKCSCPCRRDHFDIG